MRKRSSTSNAMPPASACSLSAVIRTAKASKSKLPALLIAEASKLPACGWSPRNGRRHRVRRLRQAIFLRKFKLTRLKFRVLPTRVGMVRTLLATARVMERSPHARGDGPKSFEHLRPGGKFSPRAWGWSVPYPQKETCKFVLPTRVGMVPPQHG